MISLVYYSVQYVKKDECRLLLVSCNGDARQIDIQLNFLEI